MEELAKIITQYGLVGGAFLFLLYHNNVTLMNHMKEIVKTLTLINRSLNKIDSRLTDVEKELDEIKKERAL